VNRIRKGDAVIVTAGSEKGRTGTVVGVRADGRVLAEGVNMVKKHQRPNPQRGVQGGIVQKEAPISASNVALLNPLT
jgi:large subunit ribosomal protein L24